MRIEGTKVVIGVAVGGLDEVFVWRDQEGGRTEPFRTVKDWGRTALTVLGYLGQAFDFYPGLTAPLAQSQVPLFTKSVIGAVRHQPEEDKAPVARQSRVRHVPRVSQGSQPEFRQLSAATPSFTVTSPPASPPVPATVVPPPEEWDRIPRRGEL